MMPINQRQYKRPKVGDRKLIRGVMHERQFRRVMHGPNRGALIVSSGRFTYEWVPVNTTTNTKD